MQKKAEAEDDMLQKEAIKELCFLYQKLCNRIFSDRLWCINVAIDALLEVQKYQAIGTVDEFQEVMKKCLED